MAGHTQLPRGRGGARWRRVSGWGLAAAQRALLGWCLAGVLAAGAVREASAVRLPHHQHWPRSDQPPQPRRRIGLSEHDHDTDTRKVQRYMLKSDQIKSNDDDTDIRSITGDLAEPPPEAGAALGLAGAPAGERAEGRAAAGALGGAEQSEGSFIHVCANLLEHAPAFWAFPDAKPQWGVGEWKFADGTGMEPLAEKLKTMKAQSPFYILALGDSTMRITLLEYCRMVGNSNVKISKKGVLRPGGAQHDRAHDPNEIGDFVCRLPGPSWIAFFHVYGVDGLDPHPSSGPKVEQRSSKCPHCWSTEDRLRVRLREYFLPQFPDLPPSSPDLVLLNSGLWDVQAPHVTDDQVGEQFAQHYRQRVGEMVDIVHEQFPGAAVVWRSSMPTRYASAPLGRMRDEKGRPTTRSSRSLAALDSMARAAILRKAADGFPVPVAYMDAWSLAQGYEFLSDDYRHYFDPAMITALVNLKLHYLRCMTDHEVTMVEQEAADDLPYKWQKPRLTSRDAEAYLDRLHRDRDKQRGRLQQIALQAAGAASSPGPVQLSAREPLARSRASLYLRRRHDSPR